MDFRWSGRTLYYNKSAVRLTDVLSRRLILNLGECVIVIHGEVNGTDIPVIVKLRVELDLDCITRVDDSSRRVAEREFEEESIALRELGDSGHTSRLLAHGIVKQDQSMPYPDGYIRALVMSKIPRQNVQDILLDLKEDERVIIETQLAKVLEYMHLKGWSFTDPKPKNLHWDRENKQLYLVDLEGAIPDEDEQEIKLESDIVKSFMITS